MSGPDDDEIDERDEPIALPLEFEDALAALLAVNPDDDPQEDDEP